MTLFGSYTSPRSGYRLREHPEFDKLRLLADAMAYEAFHDAAQDDAARALRSSWMHRTPPSGSVAKPGAGNSSARGGGR